MPRYIFVGKVPCFLVQVACFSKQSYLEAKKYMPHQQASVYLSNTQEAGNKGLRALPLRRVYSYVFLNAITFQL